MRGNIIQIPTTLMYEVILGEVCQDCGGTVSPNILSVSYDEEKDKQTPLKIEVELSLTDFLIEVPWQDSVVSIQVSGLFSSELSLPKSDHYDSYYLQNKDYETKSRILSLQIQSNSPLDNQTILDLVRGELSQAKNQFFNSILFTLKPCPVF